MKTISAVILGIVLSIVELFMIPFPFSAATIIATVFIIWIVRRNNRIQRESKFTTGWEGTK